MKVVVVISCDAFMEGEPSVIDVCTEEAAKIKYDYPDDSESYFFDEMEVTEEKDLTEEDYDEYKERHEC